jgi:septum formation protein
MSGSPTDKPMMTELILASTSPRRRAILSRLQIPFRVVAPCFEEISNSARSPKEEAIHFAKGKARSVASGFQNAIVIGSDTLIEYEKKKIGKPKDEPDARGILEGLQGGSHWIWTAVCMIDTRSEDTEVSISKVEVTMKPMTETQIRDYVATGEPLDKAGAYAVQGEGSRFIEELKGDYLAAIGMPLEAITEFVKRLSTT